MSKEQIQHIKLKIHSSGVDYIELRENSKILTAIWDGSGLILCVQVNPSGTLRQRKIHFCKTETIPETLKYITTIQLATDPFGGFEIVHLFIED